MNKTHISFFNCDTHILNQICVFSRFMTKRCCLEQSLSPSILCHLSVIRNSKQSRKMKWKQNFPRSKIFLLEPSPELRAVRCLKKRKFLSRHQAVLDRTRNYLKKLKRKRSQVFWILTPSAKLRTWIYIMMLQTLSIPIPMKSQKSTTI